jgi:hypothetical protein
MTGGGHIGGRGNTVGRGAASTGGGGQGAKTVFDRGCCVHFLNLIIQKI